MIGVEDDFSKNSLKPQNECENFQHQSFKELESLPQQWLALKKSPQKMYYRGDLSLLAYPKIAIIGSRKMNLYTKSLVLELASKLASKGICIVSGGALGVDIAAATGAMPCTIGIFANSLDSIYPQSNAKIIRQIYEKALALSEHANNPAPKRFDFLLRNRLIIALCPKIIIAQADLRSGSMQSARLANELEKEVFVLPQRLNESLGTNTLLAKNKAKLIANIDEFIIQSLKDFGIKADLSSAPKDEILNFCKSGARLEEALKRFGERVYEYELLGKISIDGVFVRALE